MEYTVPIMDVIANRVCGKCLARLRKSAGLTQLDVARRLDVPQSFVPKIETGERSLKLYEQFSYAKALNLDVHELVSNLQNALDNLSR